MNTKEKADALVGKFYYHEFDKVETHEATIHAINAVEYTIDVLDRMGSNEYSDFEIYNEQTEILEELKSRI